LRHALGQAFFSFFAFLVLDGLSNIERENGYRIGCVSQNIKENDLEKKKFVQDQCHTATPQK